MPRTATRSSKTRSRASRAPNAIDMLTDDHAKVRKMFKQFEKMQEGEEREKAELVQQICMELSVHAQVEEEIFYPAARDAIEEHDILDEAEVEHACAKDLIAQLEGMQPGDELYDAKVTVLGEYVDHHIKEEEKQLFPKVKKARLDLEELAEQIEARKGELMH
ncbi:MAG: hemerythrin domain-containing protein [Burkholderiales bacterium]|nr:hemerythrin domain-containing protein [Burkholderiales bacterium]